MFGIKNEEFHLASIQTLVARTAVLHHKLLSFDDVDRKVAGRSVLVSDDRLSAQHPTGSASGTVLSLPTTRTTTSKAVLDDPWLPGVL